MTIPVRWPGAGRRCSVSFGVILAVLGSAGTGAAKDERPATSIADLVKNLKSDDYGTRYAAAEKLEKLGGGAEPALPALIDALGDQGGFEGSNADFVCWMAIRTLLTIGPPAVPALAKALKEHADPNVRWQAIRVLSLMGSEAYPALPALQAAMRQEKLVIPAAAALWKLDPKGEWTVPAVVPGTWAPVEALAHCLRHREPRIRREALEALARIGPAARETVPLLIERLEDSDSEVRCLAARALGAMKEAARPAVPALLKSLRARESYLRYTAADALAKIGPRDKEAVAELIARLKDGGGEESRAAARALEAMGPDAEAAVPALIEALNRLPTATEAATALGRIGPSARAALPALRRAMKEREVVGLRRAAIRAIGTLGPEAQDAIPDLIDALAEDRREMPVPARDIEVLVNSGPGVEPTLASILRYVQPVEPIEALVSIGPAAVPALARALKDALPKVRVRAAETLGRMGPVGKTALPALSEAMKDAGGALRVEAALARWRIDGSTEATLPVLLKALPYRQGSNRGQSSRTPDWQTHVRACEALCVMGQAARPALPQLLVILRDPKDHLIRCVLRILREMGPTARPAQPALVTLLKSETPFRDEVIRTLGTIGADAQAPMSGLIALLDEREITIRGPTVIALGRLGPAARPAVPALIRALRDDEASIRASAAFSLGQIGATMEPAAGPLGQLLHDDEPIVRWAALTALEALGPAAGEAVPLLSQLVRDRRSPIPAGADHWSAPRSLQPQRRDAFESWLELAPVQNAYQADRPLTVPERAIRVLAAIGPGARAAVPALLAARNEEPRVTVRLAADRALRKIDPDALERAQPTPKEMSALWLALAGDDEEAAYRALWSMVLAPRSALSWLRPRLRPIAPPQPEQIARLIRDLDDAAFAVRQRAMKELATLGELAESALRAELRARPTLEARRRIEQLLRRVEARRPPPERLRLLRAVAVLEKIGTAEAREMLHRLAGGAPDAWVTGAAKAALRRLALTRIAR